MDERQGESAAAFTGAGRTPLRRAAVPVRFIAREQEECRTHLIVKEGDGENIPP